MSSDFRTAAHTLVDQIADFLECADERPVVTLRDPEALAAAWPMEIAAEPLADLAPLVARICDDAVNQHNRRCVGHQVSAPTTPSLLADLLVATLNNGMASYESGPVSSALERNVTRWLAARLGMPEGADGVLTSGGTLGNLTALLAARQLCLADFTNANQGANQGDSRDAASDKLCVVASEHAHYCVERAAAVMGFGDGGVVRAAVDAELRLRGEAVREAVARARDAGRRVVAVVATAGASPSGAFDPLEELASTCAKLGVWLHVDAAHGASAAMSRRYRSLLAGIERADSVVWDAHKLLSMPALVTAVLFRRGDVSYAPFAHDADYLFEPGGPPARWYDYGVRNMECTKRMLSVQLYLTLAATGTDAIDAYVTGRFDLARRFGELIAQASDFELVAAPRCNIVCFRYSGGDGGDEDAGLQDRLRRRVIEGGRFYLTRTTIAKRAALRVTLMNPRTTERDLIELLDSLRTAAAR